jgi:hypothetical protein
MRCEVSDAKFWRAKLLQSDVELAAANQRIAELEQPEPSDFDDMQALRRKVLALEQVNGDLGETIGVLKQERAKLWIALGELMQNPYADPHHLQWVQARATLQSIRIDQ